MPQTLGKKPEDIIRDDILRPNWNPTNTQGYGPDSSNPNTTDVLPIHFGTYDSNLSDPQIAIVHPNGENTIGASTSGYTGQAGDGSGPTSQRVGRPLIQCWAEHGGSYNGGLSAKDTVEMLSREVELIATEQANAPGTDFMSFGVLPRGTYPDDHNPPRFQAQLIGIYTWLKEP